MENYVKTVRSVAYARQGEPNILLVSPPHIRSCVAQDIREGRDETIDELVNTLQKMMK